MGSEGHWDLIPQETSIKPGLESKQEEPTNMALPVQDVWHLQLVPHAEQFVRMADLQVELDGKILPCNSGVLMMTSSVLCSVFEATDKATWCAGVSQAFKGHDNEDARIFLAFCHRPHRSGDGPALVEMVKDSDLEGVVRLAQKLDAACVLKICEGILLQERKADTMAKSLHWYGITGGGGMDELRTACLTDVVTKMATAPASSEEVIPSRDYDELSSSDLKTLLRGILMAQQNAKHTIDLNTIKTDEALSRMETKLNSYNISGSPMMSISELSSAHSSAADSIAALRNSFASIDIPTIIDVINQ